MKPSSPKSPFDIYRHSYLVIVVLPLITYFAVINLGFVYFDDDILILGNYEKLSDSANLALAFRSDAFFSDMSPYYRPLMNVSFMLDAMIGGQSPAVYHLSNLLYHILVSLLLFIFLQALKAGRPLSFILALIFSIHPLMGHAVMWIPARGDLLVTIFSLWSTIYLIRFLEDKKPHYQIMHVFSFLLALFSKESGAILPVVFLVLIYLKKINFLDKRLLLVYAGWLSSIILWYFLRDITIDHRPDSQRGIESVIQNIQFIPESFARLVIPFNLPVTPVFTNAITFMGIIVIIVIILLLFKSRIRMNWSMALFGFIWLLMFLLPNMYVRLTSAPDSWEYLLHRIYLPSIGFFIVVSTLIPSSVLTKPPAVMRILLGILILSYFLTSIIQQGDYRNAKTYWNSAISYAPERAFYYQFLGRYYFKQNDLRLYEKYLLKADSIRPYPLFSYNLAMINFTERKDYKKANIYFSAMLNKRYKDPEALKNYVLFCIESSNDYYKKNSIDSAVLRVKEGLAVDPENGVALYNLGIYYISLGEKGKAASAWLMAAKYTPNMPEVFRSLSMYYNFDKGNKDSASFYAEKYIQAGGKSDLKKELGLIK